MLQEIMQLQAEYAKQSAALETQRINGAISLSEYYNRQTDLRETFKDQIFDVVMDS